MNKIFSPPCDSGGGSDAVPTEGGAVYDTGGECAIIRVVGDTSDAAVAGRINAAKAPFVSRSPYPLAAVGELLPAPAHERSFHL